MFLYRNRNRKTITMIMASSTCLLSVANFTNSPNRFVSSYLNIIYVPSHVVNLIRYSFMLIEHRIHVNMFRIAAACSNTNIRHAECIMHIIRLRTSLELNNINKQTQLQLDFNLYDQSKCTVRFGFYIVLVRINVYVRFE